MPAYNADKYIAESIQSVIDQTFQDWELLIVNDGSTDRTVEIVQSFTDDRIRLLNNPQNLRLIKTLNRGLEASRGEYIARLDADDRALPDRLKLQVEALDADSNLALVGGRSNVIHADGRLKRKGEDSYVPETYQEILLASMLYNPFRHSAVTFRRDAVRSLGGYPAEFQDVEDFALWTKLLEQHSAINLRAVVCDYRVHAESVMQTAKAKSAQEKTEPRLAITRPLYEKNALRVTGDPEFASNWAVEWPKIQYEYRGDIKCFKLVMHLRSLIRSRLRSSSSDPHSLNIFIQPLRKFSRFSWQRKKLIPSFLVRLLLRGLVKKINRMSDD